MQYELVESADELVENAIEILSSVPYNVSIISIKVSYE
jgi:hypothetical protein